MSSADCPFSPDKPYPCLPYGKDERDCRLCRLIRMQTLREFKETFPDMEIFWGEFWSNFEKRMKL